MEISDREIQNKEAEVARLEELLNNAKKDLRMLKQKREAKPKNRFSADPFFCTCASRKDPDDDERTESSGSGPVIYDKKG